MVDALEEFASLTLEALSASPPTAAILARNGTVVGDPSPPAFSPRSKGIWWMTQRLVIYVTLLKDSPLVEFYAVQDTDDGGSDLFTDGFLPASNVPSEMSSLSREWLLERMAARSSS